MSLLNPMNKDEIEFIKLGSGEIAIISTDSEESENNEDSIIELIRLKSPRSLDYKQAEGVYYYIFKHYDLAETIDEDFLQEVLEQIDLEFEERKLNEQAV